MSRPPRLVVVSAHFPPNFVSGGTLVPDRQARGLAERGWDVSVYAGHLDASRPALESRAEIVDGLRVQWVEVAEFTRWSDERNIRNPGVEADFARHLEQVQPDVVHLHALQTLGAGLVEVAKAAGARTVVTMHDFWWCCGRQFLVDRTWTPCSLVVDAGACECEVDAAWRERRHRSLLSVLPHVDLVLAPSPIAAQVLRANGIPGSLLEVDENGLREVPELHDRAPSAIVRFRYTGGAERMKGAEVIRQAAHQLGAERTGWRLLVHGDVAALRELGRWPAPVDLQGGFAPSALDEVMAATEVLLVPSLMRESHSLVTREALLRGVPVICSDSLGPEQVVEDGVNGLVVPTGDADALAAAMRLAVDDPPRREAWTRAAPRIRVRREGEQLDGLDTRLRALLADERIGLGPPTEPAVRSVLFVCGIDGAPLRYRAHLPAEALALHGIQSDVVHYRDPSVPALLEGADVLVLYRVPATHQIIELLATLRARRPEVPVLFDVDDLIFDQDVAPEIPALRVLPQDEAELWMEGVRRYRTTMELCDAYVGSTEVLCRHATATTGLPSHRFANGVGALLGRASDLALRTPRTPGPLRVGYLSGTTTHDRDWRMIEDAVVDVLLAHDEVELWLGGHLTPSPRVDELGTRLRRLPMQDWTALPRVLRDLDVNLAPLEPLGRFNEAKSAIKWLEAALCATPTIASPTQPFQECIVHGVSGLLAATPDEWTTALDQLLTEDLVRARVGARARREVLLGWSPWLQGERYLAVLQQVLAQVLARGHRPASSWVAVANDEPWMPTTLSSYVGGGATERAAAPPAGPSERVAAALRARLVAVRARWRSGGGRAVARSVTRGLARDGRRIWLRIRR